MTEIQNNIKNIYSIDLEDWYQGLKVIPIEHWAEFEDRIWIGLNRIFRFLDETK
jgi:hypothetical protein